MNEDIIVIVLKKPTREFLGMARCKTEIDAEAYIDRKTEEFGEVFWTITPISNIEFFSFEDYE